MLASFGGSQSDAGNHKCDTSPNKIKKNINVEKFMKNRCMILDTRFIYDFLVIMHG